MRCYESKCFSSIRSLFLSRLYLFISYTFVCLTAFLLLLLLLWWRVFGSPSHIHKAQNVEHILTKARACNLIYRRLFKLFFAVVGFFCYCDGIICFYYIMSNLWLKQISQFMRQLIRSRGNIESRVDGTLSSLGFLYFRQKSLTYWLCCLYCV